MSIEDRVREAMRAHEHEAPTVADFSTSRAGLPTTTHRRRTTWLATAAAAACVLVVAVVVAIVRTPGDQSPAAAGPAVACPHGYAGQATPWVPRAPTVADADRRLVPDQTPAHVVVCAYLPDPRQHRQRDTVLTGRTELAGNLVAVRTTLTWLPERGLGQEQSCPLYLAKTDGDNYLIGLTYRGGTVWVSAPGDHCEGASNGRFDTLVNLLPWASAAYTGGVWVGDPPHRPRVADAGPCGAESDGRRGQESAMVPAGATSVQICVPLSSSAHPRYRTVTTSTGVAALARAFDRLPTQVSTSSCVGDGHRQLPYELAFRYADGPAVHVRVDVHCRPGVDNGSLQAADTGSVVPLIEQALAGH